MAVSITHTHECVAVPRHIAQQHTHTQPHEQTPGGTCLNILARVEQCIKKDESAAEHAEDDCYRASVLHLEHSSGGGERRDMRIGQGVLTVM